MKLQLNRGGGYIESPDWVKNKNATRNSQNNDEECFKYTVTIAMYHKEIQNNLERIDRRLLCFAKGYRYKRIKFSTDEKDWKKSEHKNKIYKTLNNLFTSGKEGEKNGEIKITTKINQAYISKNHATCKNQVSWHIITNGNKK